MLPRANRMRRRTEFTAAVRAGCRAGGSLLVVHVREGEAVPAGEPAHVGFVVSRTVGGSVVRNHVRRRLRHLMTDRLHQVPEGSLVVVRASRASATSCFGELAADLDRTLGRAVTRSRRRQREAAR